MTHPYINMSVRYSRWPWHCLLLLLLLAFSLPLQALSVSGGGEKRTGSVEVIKEGQLLPVFSVGLLDGTVVATDSLYGHPSVIVFFNTGCLDCRKELPVLQQLYEEFGRRIRFLCISREEAAEKVAAYWCEHGLTLPVSAQADRAVYSLFACRTIPRIYISDAAGRVTKVFVEKASQRKLRKALEAVLE